MRVSFGVRSDPSGSRSEPDGSNILKGQIFLRNIVRMLGAAAGDIAGSPYEFNNVKIKIDRSWLINENCRFTDDTVMTCAVADGIMNVLEKAPSDWSEDQDIIQEIEASVVDSLYIYGKKYPKAGYGGRFFFWLSSEDHRPYGSWGNGSAMRASFAGWAAGTLEEAELLAEISARVTHDHPEGIKGAKAVAGSIFLLRNGASKEDVKKYASGYYDLDFTLDEIRDDYEFDVSCQGSVPQAIVAFLTGKDFEDVLSEAISIGGDSDTIAAIAGSIAEAIYPVPAKLKEKVIGKLDGFLLKTIERANDFLAG